jgi:anti-sigma factor RsiW
MSPRIPDTHAEAWNLLPWLANGRIQPSDREWVEAHVHACAECRAELEAQRQVSSQMLSAHESPAAAITDEQRSFDKLWARIEAAETATPALTGTHGGATVARGNPRTLRTVRWLAAAVIVQGFGLALFGVNALREGDAPAAGDFRTVSTVEPVRADAPAVRVVFAPGATIENINTLLEHQGLSIVSGPGLSGNFTAALSADAVASGASAESVAAVISKDPNVTFAQPVAR